MIKAFVRGQDLQIAQPLVVTGTLNYVELKVEFKTADWEGLSKWVHLKNGPDCVIKMLDENDSITKDRSLNLTTGEWTVWIHGTSPSPDGRDITRATTSEKVIRVTNTGMEGDHPLPGIDCDTAEQIDSKAQNAVNIANQANTKSEEALTEVQKVKPYADAAEASKNAAAESEKLAKQHMDDAKSASLNASLNASSALASEKAAKQAEENAQTHATNASESASNANISEVNASNHAQSALDSKNAAKTSEEHAKTSETNAGVSEGNAKQSEDNAKTSETNAENHASSANDSAVSADEDAKKTNQVMTDFLAMLGTDVPTLDAGGKIPIKFIPATATQEIYVVQSEDELTGLTAQKGDLAELIGPVTDSTTRKIEKRVLKTWQCLGDASDIRNWVEWGTSYAVQAGNATNAQNSEDSTRINGHRMVEMEKSDFGTAAVDPNTYYLLYDSVTEV